VTKALAASVIEQIQEKQDMGGLFHPPSEGLHIVLYAVLLFTKAIVNFAILTSCDLVPHRDHVGIRTEV
jgi:hypothetical protein